MGDLGSGLVVRTTKAQGPFTARPLRLEFAGALYHVMACGNAREAIFVDDEDREAFVSNLGRVAARFAWQRWA